MEKCENSVNAAHTNRDMMDNQYWLKENKDRNKDKSICEKYRKVIKNQREIDCMNQQNFAQLKENECVYNIFEKVSGADKIYGICIERCDIRRFPSYMPLYGDELNEADRYIDYGQKTGMLVNEAVVIDNESPDRRWYYVKTYYYEGWVEKQFIAICDDYEFWLEYQKMNNFIIVTADEIYINRNEKNSQIIKRQCNKCFEHYIEKKQRLTMGTKLRLIAEDENYNYVVEIPDRDEEGNLICKEVVIPLSKEVHKGYLKFSVENIIKQAFKTLGDEYSWGGADGKRDCSSLVMEVYRCFGFLFPRDVACQKYMTADADFRELNKISIEKKVEIFDRFYPGTILGFDGHTMIYLGKTCGEYYVISYLKAFYEGKKCFLYDSCIVNSLCVKRRNGRTWFDSISYAKFFGNCDANKIG